MGHNAFNCFHLLSGFLFVAHDDCSTFQGWNDEENMPIASRKGFMLFVFAHTRKKQILSKAFWPRNHITSVEIMNTDGINERLKQTTFIHAVALNSRKYALFSFQRICLFVFVWTFNSILFRHSNNCTHSIFRSSYSYTCIFHSKFNPWILNCCFLFYLFFFSFWFDFI